MKTTYNRDSSDNAIALRALVRQEFEPSPSGDEMVLLVEEWDDANLKVGLWVQFIPRLRLLPAGGCEIDRVFMLLGKGSGGSLGDGLQIVGDPEAAMRAGESLIVHALLDSTTRHFVAKASPEFFAAFESGVLSLSSASAAQAVPKTP